MPKPLQIAGWILQLTGLLIVYIAIFTDFGPRYGSRYTVVYLLVAYMVFAYGRSIYVPAVKLLKKCPKCGSDIKTTNRECPYCHSDLHVKGRFPGINDEA